MSRDLRQIVQWEDGGKARGRLVPQVVEAEICQESAIWMQPS